MWTDAHWARHETDLKAMVSTCAVEEMGRWGVSTWAESTLSSLGLIDTQSEGIPVRGPRGYNAAQKVLGRKRVALVDADGAWLAIAAVPASTQERDTLPALDAGLRPA